ncbi:MAG TPA: ThiF family adenylyltransferase [Armatimonadota bacterium]|jgi:hypothetical protein
MSERLISHSADLQRLRDEGYDIEVRSGYLLLKDVPYVGADRKIRRGILAAELTLSGDVATAPSTHVAYFAGDHPCDRDGNEIGQIKHGSSPRPVDEVLMLNHSFSSKPPAGYPDYHEMMAAYVAIICSPAHSIDPTATARTFPVVEPEDEDSPFAYIDTASSRAGITAASARLRGRIAIVGLGGTGSYVLDLVAKTPVREIHLFDGDVFSQHNAFRSPGAPSVAELKARPRKVDHFFQLYTRMHRHIVPHGVFVEASNVDELSGMDFVFLCLDGGPAKRPIVEKLEALGTSFVDVGMGLGEEDGAVSGILRVTTSTADRRDHVRARNRIPFTDGGPNEYAKNIQIADLNALNAALAVIKWKKLCGFYLDQERELNSVYAVAGNVIINEDKE